MPAAVQIINTGLWDSLFLTLFCPKGGCSMQVLYREDAIAFTPRPYLNHAPSPALNHGETEKSHDVIYLVDDDLQLRKEITEFLTALGMRVVSFASAAEYLAFAGRDTAACVILNIYLSGMSGLELQRRLAEGANTPIIFVSDRCDIPSTVRAMKAGAIEFLTKPVDLGALLAAIRLALAQDRKQRQRKAELAKLQECLSQLTPREREVLPLVVGGLLNKQVASILGISEVTVKTHRCQVMRKMQAESFAELVRMAVKLRISYRLETKPGLAGESGIAMFVVRNGSRSAAQVAAP
jgi:RNA polymerase sigma factor (sigma-70 family)